MTAMTKKPLVVRWLAPLICAVPLLLTACSQDGSHATSAPTTSTAPAASGSGTPANGAPSSSPTPSWLLTAGSYRERAMAWGRAFAACVRTHGTPTFPDPVYPTGRAGAIPAHADAAWATSLFVRGPADKVDLARALNACPQLARQMPPPPQALEPPTALTLHHMRQFAQCMRDHGQSGFPDPKSDGSFPILGTPYTGLAPFSSTTVGPDLLAAQNACLKFQREWRLRAS